MVRHPSQLVYVTKNISLEFRDSSQKQLKLHYSIQSNQRHWNIIGRTVGTLEAPQVAGTATIELIAVPLLPGTLAFPSCKLMFEKPKNQGSSNDLGDLTSHAYATGGRLVQVTDAQCYNYCQWQSIDVQDTPWALYQNKSSGVCLSTLVHPTYLITCCSYIVSSHIAFFIKVIATLKLVIQYYAYILLLIHNRRDCWNYVVFIAALLGFYNFFFVFLCDYINVFELVKKIFLGCAFRSLFDIKEIWTQNFNCSLLLWLLKGNLICFNMRQFVYKSPCTLQSKICSLQIFVSSRFTKQIN